MLYVVPKKNISMDRGSCVADIALKAIGWYMILQTSKKLFLLWIQIHYLWLFMLKVARQVK